MEEFNTLDDILDFAIQEEIKASEFYAGLAKKTTNKAMQDAFEQFAKEEIGHKQKLEAVKSGSNITLTNEQVQDLKISDYLVDVDRNRDDYSYKEALIIAMKEEKAAYKLYMGLYDKIEDNDAKQVFLMLAQEEAKHKLRFEIEYDDVFMKEN